MYWRRTTRRINGEKRAVKVARTSEGERVRIVGFRNATDRTARRSGNYRTPFYYNTTDNSMRAMRKIHGF